MTFVSDCIDGRKDVNVIYLDFQKAFDKVPHRRLFAKLKSFGIRGNVYSWIENWLTDRKQRVVLNEMVHCLSGNQSLVVCPRVGTIIVHYVCG